MLQGGRKSRSVASHPVRVEHNSSSFGRTQSFVSSFGRIQGQIRVDSQALLLKTWNCEQRWVFLSSFHKSVNLIQIDKVRTSDFAGFNRVFFQMANKIKWGPFF